MIYILSRYVSSLSGDSPPSSSSSLEEERRPIHIPGPDTRSSFIEATLVEFVHENKFSGIHYFIPSPHYRVGDSRVLKDGIGLLIHPFFYDILESYKIAPTQLSPLAWCHMVLDYTLKVIFFF